MRDTRRCEQCARFVEKIRVLEASEQENREIRRLSSDAIEAKSRIVAEQYAILERISETHPDALAGEKWR